MALGLIRAFFGGQLSRTHPMPRPIRLLALLLLALTGATAVETPPPWAYGFKVPPPPGTLQEVVSWKR